MSGDTGSPQSWDRAKAWLRTCRQDHACSNKIQGHILLPHRVLDLQALCPSKIALYETEAEIGLYACLSHRWGTSQPLKTTKGTIKRFQVEIPETDLPKTFRDAVAVVRHLGIRYLWIDSLCIIQDDNDDWKHEASLMAQIYQNSTITLAATASSDANSGLFRQNAIAVDEDLSTLTGNLDHKGIMLHAEEKCKYHSISGRPDLLTRGWVMQERLLSPRFLHFNNELVFECNEEEFCECSRPPDLPDYLARKHSCNETKLKVMDISALYHQWHWLVRNYSTLQLTASSDILPAISGLAAVFHKYFRGRYIAGLWESTLIHELTWKIVTPRSCTRRSPWAAPTFSWASLNISRPSPEEFTAFDLAGNKIHMKSAAHHAATDWGVQWVRHAYRDLAKEQATEKCAVVDLGCTLAGSDPRGQITDAFVLLKGLLYSATVEGLNKLSRCGPAPMIGKWDTEDFWADYDYTHPNESDHGIVIGTQLHCFVLQSYKSTDAVEPDWICSLVLQRVGDWPGTEGVFERVGIWEHRKAVFVVESSDSQGEALIENLKRRAGNESGIVVDAVVRII